MCRNDTVDIIKGMFLMDFDKLRFIRKLVLIAIFSDDDLMDTFVVKGGSAIDLIYKLDSRASVDIDLSMEDDFTEDELAVVKKKLDWAIKQTFEEHDYTIFDFNITEKPRNLSPDLSGFWGGYQVEFKIQTLDNKGIISTNIEMARKTSQIIGLNNSKKFTIDISKFEYCKEKESVEIDGYTMYAYTPKMIVIEKLRAICQQMAEYPINQGKAKKSRPRDFYDITVIVNHYGMTLDEDDFELIQAVFDLKKVDLGLLSLIPNYKDFFSQDLESLRDTLTAGRSAQFNFDDCYNFVVIIAEQVLQYKNKKIAM